MIQWCKRHAGFLSVVATAVASILGIVAAVQAAMLYSHGWRVDLGSVADWLAALGSLAAFVVALVAVRYVAREWRASQGERRDREANQARLIIVEPYRTPQPNPPPPRRLFSEQAAGDDEERDAVVRNYSAAPVFDVRVDREFREAVVWEGFTEGARYPAIRSVIQPGDATKPLTVLGAESGTAPHVDYISFSFTDAHGRRWRRTGSNQPLRVVATG